MDFKSVKESNSRILSGLLYVILGLGIAVAADATKAVDKNAPATARPKIKSRGAVPGDELFREIKVHHFTLEISKASMDNLRRDPRLFVPADVTVDGQTWKQVAVHLKGAAGSFRGVDDKPALTLSFGKFTPNQTFYGLKKIHLNNSVQDGSFMCELICGEMYREVGIPAARTTFATVRINQRFHGFYVLKEGFEKELLGLFYKKPNGNLYDGGFCQDINAPLQKDCGDGPNDYSDVAGLLAATRENDAEKRWEKINKKLDVDRFLSFMVLQNLTWDWDGYVMKPNNYRVYFNPEDGKAMILPHGMDQMFWEPNGNFMGPINGLLAQVIMRAPQGRSLYQQRYQQIFTNLFQVQRWTNRVVELGAIVKTALAQMDKNYARDYQGQINRLRDLIAGRAASLSKQLDFPPPQPLAFDNGVARLRGWKPGDESGSSQFETKTIDDRKTLYIRAQRETSGSWRKEVLLPAGHYRFEAVAKCSNIKAISDEKGAGAGIRISGTEKPRANALEGTSDWKPLQFEFEVTEPSMEVILVCELRAKQGEVWFDISSLKLVKLK